MLDHRSGEDDSIFNVKEILKKIEEFANFTLR